MTSLRARTTPAASMSPGPELKHIPDPCGTARSTTHCVTPSFRHPPWEEGRHRAHPGELRRGWAGDRAGLQPDLIDSEDEARSPNPAARETSAEPFAESFSNCFPLGRGKAATKEDADPEHNSHNPLAQAGLSRICCVVITHWGENAIGWLPPGRGVILGHSQVWPPPAQSQQLRALVLESDRPAPSAQPPSSTLTSGSPPEGCYTDLPQSPVITIGNICPAPVGAQLCKLHQCRRGGPVVHHPNPPSGGPVIHFSSH